MSHMHIVFSDAFILSAITVRGLTIIDKIPDEPHILKRLLHRVGFPRVTHYGETFQVRTKANPNNAAYTNTYLGLHLDLPYYEYNPGVIIIRDSSN